MALTDGLDVLCSDENRRGGIKKLWIAERDTVDTFSLDGAASSYNYDGVTMTIPASDVFFLYEFEDFTGMMSSESNSENGSKVINRSLEFHVPKMTEAHARILQEAFTACRCILVYEDNNSETWVAGFDEILGKKAALICTVDEMTGTGLQDENGYILKFAGIGAELSYPFTGDTTLTPFEQTP